MANTKTIKKLSIAKTKSQSLLNWFLNEVHWKKLANILGYSKSGIFKRKNQLSKQSETMNAFDALAEVFTLGDINRIIELYNRFIEHPEEFEGKQRKAKSHIDLDKQKETVNKHMKDMNMKYETEDKKEHESKSSKNPEQSSPDQKREQERKPTQTRYRSSNLKSFDNIFK